MSIRVFLVDDHSIFRAGVQAEISQSDRIEVVGDAGTVADAIAGINELRPDVTLLDVHMPDGGGLQVVRNTLATGADVPTRFLCLSVSDAAEDVIALIRAGARGYVTKSIASDELIDAIDRVNSGDAVFSPRLAGYVLDAFSSTNTAPETVIEQQEEDSVVQTDPEKELILDALTKREREVLRLLARGYSYREMAERLYISTKTIETHVSNILRKTQQSSRHSLASWMGPVD